MDQTSVGKRVEGLSRASVSTRCGLNACMADGTRPERGEVEGVTYETGQSATLQHSWQLPGVKLQHDLQNHIVVFQAQSNL
jgi:hypothetical protein